MASRTQQLAETAGLGYNEGIAYGRLNDIFFNVLIFDDTSALIRAYVKRDPYIDQDEIDSFLLLDNANGIFAQATCNEENIEVFISNDLNFGIKTVSDFLVRFSRFLQSRGYYSGCAFCKNKDALRHIAKGNAVFEACPECQAVVRKNEIDPVQSYGSGAIGAILGGIVGVIPWVIVGALGYVAAICGFIMAFLSLKGYQLFKGKTGKGMVFILIAVILVFTYAAIIVNQTISDYNAYPDDKSQIAVVDLFVSELAIPFSDADVYIGDYYFTPNPGVAWAQIGLGWFFAALGSFALIKKTFKGTPELPKAQVLD
jgi:hypothetical protein